MAWPTPDGGTGAAGSFGLPLHPDPMRTKFLVALYLSGTATADAALTYVIPQKCSLVAVQFKASGTVTGALSENVEWELSTQSTGQFTTNEAQNVICSAFMAPFVATAGSQPSLNLNWGGFNVGFEPGSRLYIHRKTGSAMGGAVLRAHLYFV